MLPYIKIYKDFIEIVRELDNGARGRLFMAVLQYANGEEVANLTGGEKIAYLTLKSQIDRDREAYDDVSEKRKAAGKVGAERRWEQKDMANAILPMANDSKNGKCYQDKDKDKDKEQDKEEKKKSYILSSLRSDKYSEKKREALSAFVEHRKAMKKPMTEQAFKLLESKLMSLSTDEDEQIAILEQSILNGWQGVFALDRGKQKSGGNVFLDMLEDCT